MIALKPMRPLALVMACTFLLPAPAHTFVTLRRTTPDDAAVRWSAAHHGAIGGAGLHDGIQVAIEPAFSEKLAQAVTGMMNPADVTDIDAALAASFSAWESPVLRFALTFAGAAERGEQLGSEIDVFLVPETDAVFTNNNYFGVAFTDSARVEDRLLTNGTVSPGPAITGSDIFINETILASVAPALTRPQQLAALQRLMMHEIGHALGFHHPNEFPQSNWDTDSDPLNVMEIDPDDPTAGLQLSSNVNPNSVVSNRPGRFDALFFTSLQHDERGGRDVLYPLHAPVCLADCNGDRFATVDELVQLVNIALDRREVATCLTSDQNLDGYIRIAELVAAVRSTLTGCPFDRRLIALASTTHVPKRVEHPISRGTIRLAVRPTWTTGETVVFTRTIGAPEASTFELVKFGSELVFAVPNRRLTAEIDAWDPNLSHEITATWTARSATLYVDGAVAATAFLGEPLVTVPSQRVEVGNEGATTVLEDYVFFGR